MAALAVLGLADVPPAQEFRTADDPLADTLAKNPDCFMCHTNYGFLLYREGRVADAIDHFEASLRLKPDNVPALLNLAKIDEDRGRLDDAAARLRAALALDPADPTVLVNLGDGLDQGGAVRGRGRARIGTRSATRRRTTTSRTTASAWP